MMFGNGMEKVHDLHFSPNIIRVISSRRMRWAAHMARMGERISLEKYDASRPLGRLGVDVKIIFNESLRNRMRVN
jgi:hypothetical protein